MANMGKPGIKRRAIVLLWANLNEQMLGKSLFIFLSTHGSNLMAFMSKLFREMKRGGGGHVKVLCLPKLGQDISQGDAAQRFSLYRSPVRKNSTDCKKK